MPIKTIFLDRDGVINKEVNYLHRIEDFKFIDGIFEACIHFKKLGYKIIIVTNQSGIGRNYFKEDDYQSVSVWMIKQFQKKPFSSLAAPPDSGAVAPNLGAVAPPTYAPAPQDVSSSSLSSSGVVYPLYAPGVCQSA